MSLADRKAADPNDGGLGHGLDFRPLGIGTLPLLKRLMYPFCIDGIDDNLERYETARTRERRGLGPILNTVCYRMFILRDPNKMVEWVFCSRTH